MITVKYEKREKAEKFDDISKMAPMKNEARVAGKAKVRKNAAKVNYDGSKGDEAVRRCNPRCCNSRERKNFCSCDSSGSTNCILHLYI